MPALLQRETQAIDAVKRFGDAVASEKELKKIPALDGLRKRLLNEPLAFFKDLRGRLQSDRDTTPQSLARLAYASFDLGKLTGQIGDKQNALIAYREALPILQKLADANPADTEYQLDLAKSYNSIGLVLDEIGKTDEGIKALDSALAIRQKLADANPTVAAFQLAVVDTHQNIGLILIGKRKPAEALKTDMAQLAILQKLADANPADCDIQTTLANCYQSIGLNLRFTGKLSEALDAHRSAEVILRRVAGAEPTVNEHQSHLARCLVDIGILLRDMGNTAEALRFMSRHWRSLRSWPMPTRPIPIIKMNWRASTTTWASFSRVPESRRSAERLPLGSKSGRSWPMPTPLSSISKARLPVPRQPRHHAAADWKNGTERKAGELALAVAGDKLERLTRPAS